MNILIWSIAFVVIATLVIAIILLLANLGAYFTKIPKGTTVFLNRGENLYAILPNIGKMMMSSAEDTEGRHWLIPARNEEDRMRAFFHKFSPWTLWFRIWLWNMFGVIFISFFWPHNNRHKFDIRSRKRLLEEADVPRNAPLKARIVDSTDPEGTVVDSLLFLVPRPVYLEGLLLAGDNSRVNLLLLPVYRQVIPSLPVYYLKGDFFTQLDAALETVMVDFFSTHQVAVYRRGARKDQLAEDVYELPEDPVERARYEKAYKPSHLTYAHWLKLDKSGEESPIERRLRSLNFSQSFIDMLKSDNGDGQRNELIAYVEELTHGKPVTGAYTEIAQTIPSGIVSRFGFALVSFRTVDWEPHEDTVELARALLAKEINFHQAEGVRQEARGQRDAITQRAEGESNRYEALVNALIEKGVKPDIAAEVVRTQIRTENLRGSGIGTYVEGGSGTSMMIPVSPQGSSGNT